MIRFFAFLTVLALSAAIFAACGSGDNSSKDSVTPAPSGVTAGNWTISGQLVGSMDLTASGCQHTGQLAPTWGAQVTGTLNGTVIGVFLATPNGGTTDLSTATADTLLSVHYGAVGAAINDYWLAVGGGAGATGTVTVDSDGSGSMTATLPISPVANNGATRPITISGQWVCP
jgi:hypothetical protein